MAMPASPPDTAVLLVNLGTPDAPTPSAVRRYLTEFLSDPRVVSLPKLLWQPLLRGLILPLRSPRVAEKYASIWLPGGSPLAVHTRDLAAAVQARLPRMRVTASMRYGTPPLRDALADLRAAGVRRVLVLPLYPQYSTTTTASVADITAGAPGLQVQLVEDYHLDAGWVAALADSIRDHRAAQGTGDHLLFSFHGLPQRLVDAGDPYQHQCEASARAIAQALQLPDGAWSTCRACCGGRCSTL